LPLQSSLNDFYPTLVIGIRGVNVYIYRSTTYYSPILINFLAVRYYSTDDIFSVV